MIAADAVLIRPVGETSARPGSWANREENFSGLLLHWDDPILKYNEVQVRIDGPLDDLIGDELKLTFDEEEINVYYSDDGEPGAPIDSGHAWPITSSFEPFEILVEGKPDGGHTELVLTVDPDPDRPIADKLFIIVNE